MHFSHKNIIRFDSRPFFTLDEMKRALIDNWNSRVEKSDEVYVLGDMFWNNSEAPEILDELNGKKFLLKGNHDHFNSNIEKRFEWIKKMETVTDNGQKIVLCHFPIAHWQNQDYGTIHFYAHIHQGRDTRPYEMYQKMCLEMGIPFPAYNVGCMMPYMDYTPRTKDEIISGFNSWNCLRAKYGDN